MVISNPAVLLELNGSTVSFGVYLGGVIGFFLYSRMYRIDISRYLDTMASVLGIGPMIGRIACFLNGDDYGKLSNLPWAVRFPHGSFPFIDQVANGLISPMDDLSMPVHPVQLYGCLKGIVLFIAFSYLWKKNYFKPGVLFCLFWACYATMRFILEYFRGDMNRGFVGPFSTGQIMSLLILSASLIYVKIQYRGRIRNGHLVTNEYALITDEA
jgi:phosphatidylglycerol:prolipoprotein diacylglycerol transferase